VICPWVVVLKILWLMERFNKKQEKKLWWWRSKEVYLVLVNDHHNDYHTNDIL
jgi:hypothetical protein